MSDSTSTSTPTKRVLVVQHQGPVAPYRFQPALEGAGLEVDLRRVHEGDELPDSTEGLAGLVVLGGTMSAYEDEGFPTRRHELALLEDALERDVPTFGVCLGSQLLASAAGGDAYEGHEPKVDWSAVRLTDAAADDPLFRDLPQEVPAVIWQTDTFELPPGAVHLAESSQYPNQAFRIGERAWGLQFHLELDDDGAEAFVEADPEEAAEAPGGEQALLERVRKGLPEAGPHWDGVLERFAALVADPGPSGPPQRADRRSVPEAPAAGRGA